MENDSKMPHIVVLGAGFGGLQFCRKMRDQPVKITLIDRQNHHLFQPLLYQVATAGLSAPEIAAPIRTIFSKQRNLRVLLDETTAIDPEVGKVFLRETGEMTYDHLVLAVGARTTYYGNDAWAKFAPGLKTLDDATRIRDNVLLAFEEAERERDSEIRKKLMRIVVVGGGPTGVELAGAFAELSKKVLARDFKNIDVGEAEILLLEVSPRIMTPFSEKLSESARCQLEQLGVEVRLNQKLRTIKKGKVELEDGFLEAGNIIWGAGVQASPVCKTLDVETDKAGRIMVEPDLRIPGYPKIFAIGDIVNLKDREGKPVPGVSPAAMQMGRYVAKVIKAEQSAKTAPKPFKYINKGNMATIGRSHAIAEIGKLELSGFPAWIAWLIVHLIFLVGFRNKIAVLLQWFYSYVTFRRGARIITGLDRIFSVGNSEARPASRAEKQSRTDPVPSADVQTLIRKTKDGNTTGRE